MFVRQVAAEQEDFDQSPSVSAYTLDLDVLSRVRVNMLAGGWWRHLPARASLVTLVYGPFL